jgi:hypothetical protein
MQGPPESVYAVSLSATHQSYSALTNLPERPLQNPRFPPQRLPIQAANHQLQDQDLPPERIKRRTRCHVPGHAACRRVEAAEQDQGCACVGQGDSRSTSAR